MKNWLPKIFILLLLIAISAGIYSSQRGLIKPQMTPTPQAEEFDKEQKIELRLEAVQNARGNKNTIALFLEPTENPVIITAFDLNLVITKIKDFNLVENPKLIPNDDWLKEGWTFPLKEVSKSANVLKIQFSGYHIGTQGYILKEKTELGYTESLDIDSDKLMVEVVDRNQTRFFGKDAVTQIQYEIK